ncbi:hypothetical protein VIGAN_06033400 [Vigna angularis var. angularis]|uniref:Knottin scorpion toxin-like domain-containing protein n=1 Tax=Vigna angularis var. angularis TaxID=157739 RepID=A0A0S3S9B1_PHAAN|nr:hypothetical protein VIGAN_06033400 [Vigna angularis var. angularis]
MAKISFFLIFTLTLIITAISRTSGAMPEKPCMLVLNPNYCNLSTCRKDCEEQYHGTGYCVDKYPHKCVCVYVCSR